MGTHSQARDHCTDQNILASLLRSRPKKCAVYIHKRLSEVRFERDCRSWERMLCDVPSLLLQTTVSRKVDGGQILTVPFSLVRTMACDASYNLTL